MACSQGLVLALIANFFMICATQINKRIYIKVVYLPYKIQKP